MVNISEKRINSTPGPVPFFFRFIATGFLSGYSPIVPGTAGSLVGLAIYVIPNFEIPSILFGFILITFFIGTYASSRMEKYYGDDPSIVVIDEIVGMWISLLFLPKSWVIGCIAFVAFRFYDIVKPPPARRIEKLANGWGIMLDDLFAGVYANITLQVMLLIFPGLG